MLRILALPLVVLVLAAPGAFAQGKLTADCEAGNQQACATLARSSSASMEIRVAAVRKLTDQQLLTELARTSPVGDIRAAAIHGIIDQDTLADIARHAKSAVDRGTAIERLKDQALLADIARTDPSKWVRRRAANCLTDEAEIDKLVAEGRKELLPTLVAGGGIRHVLVDGKEMKESLLGVTSILPGRHTISADFAVTDDVTWEGGKTRSVTLDAQLGSTYVLEADIGIVTWQYLSPQTRRGHGTWTLVAREAVSPGPNLLPQLLR
jgi:hypothetical protein